MGILVGSSLSTSHLQLLFRNPELLKAQSLEEPRCPQPPILPPLGDAVPLAIVKNWMNFLHFYLKFMALPLAGLKLFPLGRECEQDAQGTTGAGGIKVPPSQSHSISETCPGFPEQKYKALECSPQGGGGITISGCV